MIKSAKENQKDIIKLLQTSFKKKRLSHAYLFQGEQGTEKLGVALYFAMMLYCTNDNSVCEICHNCELISELKHMNVYYIEPDNRTIKKEQIAKLQEEFSKTSLIDGPRVYIIDGVETMTLNAANSLLKFIEEPTNKETYAILLTNNILNVIPTIISRCQVINFKSINSKIIKEELLRNNASELESNLIPCITNSKGESLNYLVNPSFKRLIEITKKIGQHMAHSFKSSIILEVKNDYGLLDDKDNFITLIKLLIIYLRDTLVLNDIVFESELETMKKINKNNAIKYLKELFEIEKKISGPVNFLLLLELFLLNI